MTNDPLVARIDALRSELKGLSSLDAQARRAASGLDAELERLGVGVGSEAPPSSATALEAQAVRFEAEHPALSAALRQAADLLGKAGI